MMLRKFNIFLVRSMHAPVMREEVKQYLRPGENLTFIDMTFGAGGHSRSLLEASPKTKIFCLDRDPKAYQIAKDMSLEFPDRVIPCFGKFSDCPVTLGSAGVKQGSIDGILFDFGCSSMQLDNAERGFSISKEGPLDMRMDPNSEITAKDVLDKADQEDLAKIFKVYGEEKLSKKIARGILESRYTFRSLKTTKDLSELIADIVTDNFRMDKLQRPTHVATKIFQALRIFVNNELNEINYGLVLAHKYLKIGGRLVTLSFHSLEDRIVKQHLTGGLVIGNNNLKSNSHTFAYTQNEMDEMEEKNWLPLTKHVVTPSPEEVEINPRSRSAKLRAAVKIK